MRNMTREEQASKILDSIWPGQPRDGQRSSDVALVAAYLMEISVIEREEERNVCAAIAERAAIPGHSVAGLVCDGIAKRIRERRIS
jgi:hypothetical protein